MRLKWLHPKLYDRPCQLCLKYMYDSNGDMEWERGHPSERLLNAGPSHLAPCQDPERGCPKGTPENSKTLLPCNVLALEHYRECRAVGQFPDDPIVRRNAVIIREVEDEMNQRKESEFQKTMIELVALAGVKT